MPGGPVEVVQALDPVDREGVELVMLVHREGSGRRRLRIVRSPVDIVPARDDDVVAAAEESGRRRNLLLDAQFVDLGRRLAGRLELVVDHGQDVGEPLRVCEVGGLALGDPVGQDVAVVGVPVVEAQDLEQVRDCLLYTSRCV